MGSDKILCINQAVSSSGSTAHAHDRCLELLKQMDVKKKGAKEVLKAGKAKKGCPFLSQKGQHKFKRNLLHAPHWQLVPLTDLVVSPYQGIISNISSCEGISQSPGTPLLFVVISEAHNLVDTIASINSCRLSKLQIVTVQLQLGAYLDRS
eukprot:SM000139S00116  [mRNA]  locus=s139:88270:89270:+ [translate_table: standard]